MSSKREKTQASSSKSSPPPVTVNSSVSVRHSRKVDLGGVIFGCKNYTISECFKKKLFGEIATRPIIRTMGMLRTTNRGIHSLLSLTEKLYKDLPPLTQKVSFTVPFLMLAYPVYLWKRSPVKRGSHFDPNSDLFNSNERNDVVTSTLCWVAMVALLVGLSIVIDPIPMLKLYIVLYWIFFVWLNLVTYLHHHGHEQKLTWFFKPPLVAWYLSNLPAYRSQPAFLRGIKVGLAHGYLLVGPFVMTSPLRNIEYAGAAGSLAAAGLVVIPSVCLTTYRGASFKEGEPSIAPSLTLTGRKNVADKLQTSEG